MSSTYGEHLKLSIFGQSHGAAIGMTLDGIPAGLPVDFEVLQAFLNRRAPGRNDWSTPRKEEDRPEFLAGILDGFTCGAPIAAVIHNTNTRSGDYASLADCPRPGHADYTAQVKYDIFVHCFVPRLCSESESENAASSIAQLWAGFPPDFAECA